MNHFELFEIPVTFLPDLSDLKRKFYVLSRKYHPDFYTRENDFEQGEALDKSSQVNKAFKILQNRDETIKYVLQLKGLLEEEEKYNLPADFLMEMMDLNEQMMEAKMEEDAAATRKLKTVIAAVENEIYIPVKGIIEGYKDGQTGTEELLKDQGILLQEKISQPYFGYNAAMT